MVKNIDFSLRECIKTMTQQVLSEHELDEIMNRKQEFSAEIKTRVANMGRSWGVEIIAIDIKDIAFSDDLKETLSMSAKSKRISESKIIIARGEVEAARLMKETATLLSSDAAMQIRHLEAMTSLAKSQNSKIIFLPQEYNPSIQHRAQKAMINSSHDRLVDSVVDTVFEHEFVGN